MKRPKQDNSIPNKLKEYKNQLRSKLDMNRTLDEDKPGTKNKKSTIDATKNLNSMKAHNHSQGNLKCKDTDSVAFSGLSLKDEWTEIQLYNGILHNMRRDHEVKAKQQKI